MAGAITLAEITTEEVFEVKQASEVALGTAKHEHTMILNNAYNTQILRRYITEPSWHITKDLKT